MARFLLTLLLLCLMAAPAAAQAPKARAPLKVVASFSIIADLVRQVGAERVVVTPLVGAEVDAHGYQPSAQDAMRVAQADLIFTNGLGFDGWIERLIKASKTRAPHVVLGLSITPIISKSGKPDPHVWHDSARVRRYVEVIAQTLSQHDKAGALYYQQQAAAYQRKLQALEARFKSRFSVLDPSRRTLLTAHDAFGYLAQSQGLNIIAVKGLSTQSEPSAGQLARLVDQIKAQKIQAIFYEKSTDQRLINLLAQQTAVKVGGTLYSDALSRSSGPAASYLALMQYNLETIALALAGPTPRP
jgi:zinc/manganese transport system substrate-binding protein